MFHDYLFSKGTGIARPQDVADYSEGGRDTYSLLTSISSVAAFQLSTGANRQVVPGTCAVSSDAELGRWSLGFM